MPYRYLKITEHSPMVDALLVEAGCDARNPFIYRQGTGQVEYFARGNVWRAVAVDDLRAARMIWEDEGATVEAITAREAEELYPGSTA